MAIRYLSGIDVDSNTLFVDDANNRVGIGTGSPAYKLDVSSDIRIGEGLRMSPNAGSLYAVDGALSYYSSTNGVYLNGAGTNGWLRLNASGAENYNNCIDIYGGAAGAYMVFRTNNSERMRITSGGNVGIGTTSPSTRLEVLGDTGVITIRTTYPADLSQRGALLWKDGANITGAIDTRYDGTTVDMYFGSLYSSGYNSTTRMVIKGNGNVGIGTTSPSYKLDISTSQSIRVVGSSNGYTQGSIIFQSSTTDSPGARGLGVYLFNEGNDATWFYGTGYGAGDTFLINRKSGATYQDSAAAPAESSNFLAITNAGNVGIGTTAPTSKLYIEGGSADWNETTPGLSVGTIHLDPGTDTNDYGNAITFGASDAGGGTNAQAGIYLRSDGNYGTKMYFATTDSYAAGSKTRMFIGHDGNVGIGTTSPATKLDVNGGINIANGNNLTWGGAYAAGIPTIVGYNAGAGGALYFYPNGSTSGTKMFIASDGNVGIGTTSPASLLHIYGSGNTFTRYTNTTSAGHYIDIGANSAGQSFIYGYGAYPLLFATNGSEAMRIASGGNVGVGNTNPEAKLHVSGLKSILSNYGVGSSQFFTYEIVTGTSSSTNQTFDMYMGRFGNGYHRVVLWGSGYGTDVGNYFDITRSWGTGSAPRIISNGGLYIGGATYTIHWAAVSYGQYDLFIKWTANMPAGYSNTISYAIQSNTGSGYTQFDYPSGVTVPTLNSSNLVDSVLTAAYNTGNVGIGTTAPTAGYKLDVVGSILSQVASGNTSIVVSTNNANGAMNAIAGSGLEIATDSTNQNISFRTGASSRMYIKSDGNVGIGTTNPFSRFTVARNGINEGTISYEDESNNAHLTISGSDAFVRLQFGTYNNGSYSSWIQSSYDNSPGGSGASGAQGLAINPQGGNVGIGTPGPSEKLHVSGNIRVTGAYYDSSNSAGSSGQVLSSTGSGTDWVSLSEITGVDGTGTANYIAKWSDTDTIANSQVFDNGTNVGINNASPKTRLDVNGAIGFGSKTLNISDTFVTVLTVNMSNHTGCYVKITAFGDWSAHSAVAYLGEFFLQNGASAYNEPGVIIRQVDNTNTDDIVAQIVDPAGTGTRDFEIQLKTTSASGVPFSAAIQYEVRGQYNSVS